ncbi:hypothetical protein AB1N83_004924 [Pleurotus pulmonarius]
MMRLRGVPEFRRSFTLTEVKGANRGVYSRAPPTQLLEPIPPSSSSPRPLSRILLKPSPSPTPDREDSAKLRVGHTIRRDTIRRSTQRARSRNQPNLVTGFLARGVSFFLATGCQHASTDRTHIRREPLRK